MRVLLLSGCEDISRRTVWSAICRAVSGMAHLQHVAVDGDSVEDETAVWSGEAVVSLCQALRNAEDLQLLKLGQCARTDVMQLFSGVHVDHIGVAPYP